MKIFCTLLLLFVSLWLSAQDSEVNSAMIMTGPIRVTQTVPSKVLLSKVYLSEIALTAEDNAGDIIVTSILSDGNSYVASDPPANVDGNKLTWKFDSMNRGEKKILKISLNPTVEGNITCCTKVTSVPMCCVTSYVGKAILSIKQKGPELVRLGETVLYETVVKNIGSAVAENVSVVDEFPKALTHSTYKNKVGYILGNLAPGREEVVTFSFQASQRDKIRNTVSAQASNARTVRAFADTTIVLEEMKLALTCPPSSYLRKEISSTIVLSNPGDTRLENIVLTAYLPDTVKVLIRDGTFEVQEKTLVWKVENLIPGLEKSYSFSVISEEIGNHPIHVQAACSGKGLLVKETCATQWKGLPALSIEVVDSHDPLMIDQETDYIIHVTNQGTAEDTNVKVVAQFPIHMTPVEAWGPTEHKIEGKFVLFTPYMVLKMKQVLPFKIRAKAAQAGDARIKIFLYSNLLQEPVIEEESTQVY